MKKYKSAEKCKEMEFFVTWKAAADIEKADHHKPAPHHHRITPEEWKKLMMERKATFSKMTKEDWVKYKKDMPAFKKDWAMCMKKYKSAEKCKEMEFFVTWKAAADI